ncbi:MAG: 4Fe-4S binding protein [Desulfobacteraceae bacterium]|nr:4Fe-4S binding protein [Desulfobacteraceae bacterium]
MVESLRLFCQHISFLIMIYGGRLGIRLGNSLPCFTCPYVSGCAGHCYLMVLQRSSVGFQTAFDIFFSGAVFNILWPFAVFLLFFIPLSKLWCSWICPFCLVQDWISLVRKKFYIREMILTRKTRNNIKPVKYILLVLLITIPLAIANFNLHSDWALPFCQICPGKPILPLFQGNWSYFHINYTNGITMAFSFLSMVITGGMLVGMFFRERFFCMFCPMLALMHLLKAISPVRFEKKIHTCTGCGNCERSCPVDIPDVHLEKVKKNVLTQDCMGCMSCVEACPADHTLTFKWFGFRLFSSSRSYLSRKWSQK